MATLPVSRTMALQQLVDLRKELGLHGADLEEFVVEQVIERSVGKREILASDRERKLSSADRTSGAH